MGNPIVSPDDVAIGRPLTSAEEDRADLLCDSVVGAVELSLHRYLYERTVLKERHRTGSQGRVIPFRAPVVRIDGVRYGSATALPTPYPEADDWEAPGAFRANSTVWIDYTAGDPFPDVQWAATATDLLANAVARVILAPMQVATGVIRGYSVEGTSITYGSSEGRLSAGDLGVLKSLKVPTVR